jgi:hypothetical protein
LGKVILVGYAEIFQNRGQRMMMGKSSSVGRLVVFIILGLILGGILGEVLGLVLGQIGVLRYE